MSPQDKALAHVVWARERDMSPHDVMDSVGFSVVGSLTWGRVVDVLSGIAMKWEDDGGTSSVLIQREAS